MGNDAIYQKLIEMQGDISTLQGEITAIKGMLQSHLDTASASKKRWYDNFDKLWIGAVGAVIGIGLDTLKTRLGWK
jgi:hypothetical protein